MAEHSATALTLNEMRHYLRTSEMPENYRGRVELALEVDGCSNCDNRRCMGCVFREWDHECVDDCPFCCEQDESTKISAVEVDSDAHL